MSSYNLINEFSENERTKDVSTAPHWVIAIVRLNKPLSYSRKEKKSTTFDVSEGAKTRGKTLIITGDCVSLSVQRSKDSHVKSLSAQLIQSNTNYLVEILPGDWMLAWMVNGVDKQQDLIRRIKKGDACNKFEDGFKFFGRVDSIRKRMSRARESGMKHTTYSLRGHGFREFDSQIFYDHFLGENSIEAEDLGRWLSKVGLDIANLIRLESDGQRDNGYLMIAALLEVFLGKGVSSDLNTVKDNTALRQVTGGGIFGDAEGKIQEAPFAYLVPKEVGDLIGKKSREPSKAGGILAYADCYELVFGVQEYEDEGDASDYSVFSPKIDKDNELTKGNQKFTGNPLMGAFLPNMPDFDNRPLWNVVQQYLNPVLNEMYTCLRVNTDGDVVPTVMLRQIPFTTNTLSDKISGVGTKLPPFAMYDGVKVTPFLSLPRWVLPGVLVNDVDLGRSDASRCNFVHVYGQNADVATNIPITDQLVNNEPVRDDFDIQRSGLHSFMTTVACREINEIGTTPGVWMEIIADHRIGSQYTLNGTIHCVGIQAPICEGDNLQFDGVVYHIESLDDQCMCDPGGGNRTWTTMITVTNGLRDFDYAEDTNSAFPIYPGFRKEDNTAFDPIASSDDQNAKDEPDSEKDLLPFDPDSDDEGEE